MRMGERPESSAPRAFFRRIAVSLARISWLLPLFAPRTIIAIAVTCDFIAIFALAIPLANPRRQDLVDRPDRARGRWVSDVELCIVALTCWFAVSRSAVGEPWGNQGCVTTPPPMRISSTAAGSDDVGVARLQRQLDPTPRASGIQIADSGTLLQPRSRSTRSYGADPLRENVSGTVVSLRKSASGTTGTSRRPAGSNGVGVAAKISSRLVTAGPFPSIGSSGGAPIEVQPDGTVGRDLVARTGHSAGQHHQPGKRDRHGRRPEVDDTAAVRPCQLPLCGRDAPRWR
jgi:hypothetical protein